MERGAAEKKVEVKKGAEADSGTRSLVLPAVCSKKNSSESTPCYSNMTVRMTVFAGMKKEGHKICATLWLCRAYWQPGVVIR